VLGFSLLEVVNYLEHYGLLRRKLADGRYERCQPRHSWNSNHVVTNLFLYQLQRHSDHHANPTRRYQALRHFDDSPQLPAGYAALIIVAYFPPLWFRLMDRRVVAHHHGDLRNAHLHGPRREALLAKYPVPVTEAAAAEAAVEIRTAAPADAAALHRCPNCEYVYNPRLGCPQEGYPAGTSWASLPQGWTCPQCAVREKPDFVAVAG
jgi:alkane 1-monooxygenase